MAFQWMGIILLLSLSMYSTRGKLYDWILYSNSDKNTDCFLYDFRYFCRSIHNNITERKTNTTCINSELWSFLELEQNKVTTDQLMDWLIPFHVIELYAEYLNSTYKNTAHTNTICNCTQNRIGLECEYEIVSKISRIGNVIISQRGIHRENSKELPTSFIDEMPCNAGALSLEWRQVCDGIVNCQDAIDELNCHLLEFNQCDTDEFQCRNGMCIPREFLYDAMPDCMDTSDEQEVDEIYIIYSACSTYSSNDCDERLCRKDQFSCGDGECVPWATLIDNSIGCQNSREAAYICEIVDQLMIDHAKLSGICQQTRPSVPPLTNTSGCISSIWHLLSANRINRPNETRMISFNNIISRCPELIQYPEQAVLSPVLKMYYNKSWIRTYYENGHSFREQMPRKPHFFCLNGSMICNGIWRTLQRDHCMGQTDFQKLTSYPYLPISHLFCQIAAEQASHESDSSLQSKGRNQSQLLLSYACKYTSDHLSLRRVNDGYSDCLYGDDEKNSAHIMTEPLRYRCQTVESPAQYVSYQQLGNGIRECADGSDEISQKLRWSSFKCDADDNYACWVFQGDGIHEDRIKDVQLSFHRYCDSVWDTMDGQDEKNCSQWLCAQGTFQCNSTGQCIDPTYFCDGEFDCDDGEDELNCTRPLRQWTLESECDNTYEHFCITLEYLQNQTTEHPCIHYFKAGDGKIDCIGGRDERNVFSCSDHLTLGDRFLCDNATKCLNYTVLCDGIDDCFDRTDELICFWDRELCDAGQFACSNGKECRGSRCDPRDTCSNKANWFWCPNSTAARTIYRLSKNQRLSSYEMSCYKNPNAQLALTATKTPLVLPDTRAAIVPIIHGFCNLGFYLTTGNGLERHCFCSPSYYGDRCQFDSRRVTIRVRFDRRHRFDIPAFITVLVLFVYNNSQIIDHQIFTDLDTDFPPKYDLYLLYPRPKLQGSYTVRFEAYHSIDLLAAWEYAISPLDFLPAFRLAKVLRFPDRNLPWLCAQNQCQNNATCYVMNNGRHLCLCQRGWEGAFCEKTIDSVKCAPHSLARDRHICICPYGYLEPHCFVRNTACEQSQSCSSKDVCYPAINQPPNLYRCVCNASSCDPRKTFITMDRQGPNPLAFLLQLLKISSDYPRVRQQILVHPSTEFPITITIKTRDMRNVQGAVPEIGLLFTFQPLVRSVDIIFHLLFINCSTSLRNYTVDLDVQPQRCRSLSKTEFHSLTFLRRFCQESVRDSCFLFDGYICYCSSQTIKQSECISYHQRHITCTHCLNQGYCVQGDLQNKSDFACVCPKCASGKLCQFSPSRFLISLEFLIEMTNWGRYHFVGPIIFFLVGMLFNTLSLVTFARPKIRKNGIGVFFLVNSISSQLSLIFLFIRVVYLYLARQMIIKEEINRRLCNSLPYCMTSLHYVSLWLMAFVTVERALVVTLPTRFLLLRAPRSAIIAIILTFVFVLGSSYVHIDLYKLVSHPDDLYPWCISEIESNQQYLIQFLSLAHQIIPFLINFIAGLAIIITVSRSKSRSHHLPTRSTLAQQTRKRIDLLFGPIICFITQLPQLIILFLDICDYYLTSWFIHLIMAAYYISFTPQISLFFLYLLPSTLYKEILFKDTKMGKQLVKIIPSLAHWNK